MTKAEWVIAHHLKEGTDLDEEQEEEEEEDMTATAAKAKVITIPPMSIIDNPGYFVIGEKWKEGEIARKRETHSQKLQSFLWKTNIEQAVNLELTDAIPKSLLSDPKGSNRHVCSHRLHI